MELLNFIKKEKTSILICTLLVVIIIQNILNIPKTAVVSEKKIWKQIEKQKFSTTHCNCIEFYDLDYYKCKDVEITFISPHYYMTLCESDEDSLILHQKIDNEYAGYYSNSELIKLYYYLSKSVTYRDNKKCEIKSDFFNLTKAEYPVDKECLYYISFENLLSLCFANDKYLSRGFINSTIFTGSDICEFYFIVKNWVIEE